MSKYYKLDVKNLTDSGMKRPGGRDVSVPPVHSRPAVNGLLPSSSHDCRLPIAVSRVSPSYLYLFAAPGRTRNATTMTASMQPNASTASPMRASGVPCTGV